MGTLLTTYSPVKLEPYQNPQGARTIAAQIAASQTVVRGTLLSQKTSDSKFYPYAGINDVQQVKIVGTLTAGTWRLSATKSDGSRVTTDAIAYNASNTDIATALNAVLGASAAAVAIPTSYALGINVTFSGTGYAGVPQPLMSVDDEGLTTATTSSVTDTTALTGTEKAKAIAVYDFITNSAGQVIYTTTAGLTPDFQTGINDTAEVYIAGDFLESDLTGLDAAAIAALNAREIGIGAYKVLHIP